VTRRGNKLTACDVKETRVGKGAFIKTETEIVTLGGEILARIASGLFLYTPHAGGKG
jgi:hypothetical protein